MQNTLYYYWERTMSCCIMGGLGSCSQDRKELSLNAHLTIKSHCNVTRNQGKGFPEAKENKYNQLKKER